jgi:PhnB protein
MAEPFDDELIFVGLIDRLRLLPTEVFRIRLKEDLMQQATITVNRVSHLPEGFRSVTPYLITPNANALMDFMKQAFGAVEKLRVPTPEGKLMHGEVRLGDSILELSDGSGAYPPSPTALHLYVPDVDATYALAIRSGATSVAEPTDQFYGDREASVKDPSGNYWYIATHKNRPGHHIPEGMYSLMPFLHPKGADGQIRFLVEGLGGVELGRYANDEGRIMHAVVRIGNGIIELGEAHDQWQPMPASIHVHVPDCDAVYHQAIAAGGTSIHPLTDQPYGERSGGVLDPFGNRWWIATNTGR